MRTPGAVQAFDFFASGLSLMDSYVSLVYLLRSCICRMRFSGMIITKIAPVPLNAEPKVIIVAVLRIVRAQLIDFLRSEICLSFFAAYFMAWLCQAAVTFMSS